MSNLQNQSLTRKKIEGLPINPYFIFLAQFRENLKLRNLTNIKVTTVAQMAGRKWREMTNTQRAVYVEIAKRNREMKAYQS